MVNKNPFLKKYGWIVAIVIVLGIFAIYASINGVIQFNPEETCWCGNDLLA